MFARGRPNPYNRRMWRGWLLGLWVAIAYSACGGSGGQSGSVDAADAHPDAAGAAGRATGGTGVSTGGKGGAGGAGGVGGVPADAGSVCTPPDNTATAIPGAFSADPAPAPMGGTITTGVYHLTDLTYHGGSSTCQITVKETLDIVSDSDTTGTVRDIEVLDGYTYPTYYHYTTSGSTMTADQFCNITNTFSEPYTATQTQLLFFVDVSADCATSRLVSTYTKQ